MSEVASPLIQRIHFVLIFLYFVRTDLKTHIRILKIVDKIFHIVPSCSQMTANAIEDHLVPGESFLFA
ncbi:unnamed protein product [Rotaria sp. Silwood2]|nr:unnamed protein product [Rotaria sp. Silwood2]CAF4442152.1 unnamed protein product [Rotaria sp. Silwood2]